MNMILNTDSYKLSHFLGYPRGTEYMYSYAESRGGIYPETVFVGLQGFMLRYLTTPITTADVDEAEAFAHDHGEPFNREGWDHIVKFHGGRLPLRIRAVPEGTVLPTRNVFCTVENTDPKVPWLTSYIETALMRIWYPITVATRIHGMKKRIKPYYDRTSSTGFMDFGVIDFSSRGVSSYETSEIGGLGHLISFGSSDNIPAIRYAREYYGSHMSAVSVPATEHSIMTAFGQDHELESFKYLIDNMMPRNGILSVVSDTWDIFEASRKWAMLAERIRDKNGTLVVRPDSGHFRAVLPKVMMILKQGFGSTTNSKGFEVLNNVKILQGDGIDEKTVEVPFEIAEQNGISADSVLTGSGGGLMSKNIDRDTCKFAFKASHVVVNGKGMDIAKNPITDPGKQSKKGKLKLIKDVDTYHTVSSADEKFFQIMHDEMRTVYLNGEVTEIDTLDKIRERLARHL